MSGASMTIDRGLLDDALRLLVARIREGDADIDRGLLDDALRLLVARIREGDADAALLAHLIFTTAKEETS